MCWSCHKTEMGWSKVIQDVEKGHHTAIKIHVKLTYQTYSKTGSCNRFWNTGTCLFRILVMFVCLFLTLNMLIQSGESDAPCFRHKILIIMYLHTGIYIYTGSRTPYHIIPLGRARRTWHTLISYGSTMLIKENVGIKSKAFLSSNPMFECVGMCQYWIFRGKWWYRGKICFGRDFKPQSHDLYNDNVKGAFVCRRSFVSSISDCLIML